MNKNSKYRPLMDEVLNGISSGGMGVTGVYQWMLESLDEAEAVENKLTADNAALVEALEGLKSKLRELEQNELESLELDDIECNEIEILKAENQALRNELEVLKAIPRKMAKNAAECEDHFLGGYQSKEELEIFIHGMRTVASCMENYANKLEQGE